MADDVKQQQDHEFRMSLIATLQLFIGKIQPIIIVGFICIAVVMSSRFLAGKITMADIAFRLFADFKGIRGLAMLAMGGLGTGGVFYGQQQRKLRIKTENRNPLVLEVLPSVHASKSLEKGG